MIEVNEKTIENCKRLGMNTDTLGSCLFVLDCMDVKNYSVLEVFDDSNTNKNSLRVYKELEKHNLLKLDPGGYLNFELTEEGRDFIYLLRGQSPVIRQESLTDWIKDWINLWKDPNTGISYKRSGQSLACSERDGLNRMNKFLKDYSYLFESLPSGLTTKDVILGATEKYIKEFKKLDFAFCKNAYNFIMKQEGSTKDTNNSTLAAECENFIKGYGKLVKSNPFDKAIN